MSTKHAVPRIPHVSIDYSDPFLTPQANTSSEMKSASLLNSGHGNWPDFFSPPQHLENEAFDDLFPALGLASATTSNDSCSSIQDICPQYKSDSSEQSSTPETPILAAHGKRKSCCEDTGYGSMSHTLPQTYEYKRSKTDEPPRSNELKQQIMNPEITQQLLAVLGHQVLVANPLLTGAAVAASGMLSNGLSNRENNPAGAGSEKRSVRKANHSIVERRYRNNINDRITEIKNLLPDNLTREEEESKQSKAAILKRASEYIAFLKQRDQQQKEQIQKLRTLVENLGGSKYIESSEGNQANGDNSVVRSLLALFALGTFVYTPGSQETMSIQQQDEGFSGIWLVRLMLFIVCLVWLFFLSSNAAETPPPVVPTTSLIGACWGFAVRCIAHVTGDRFRWFCFLRPNAAADALQDGKEQAQMLMRAHVMSRLILKRFGKRAAKYFWYKAAEAVEGRQEPAFWLLQSNVVGIGSHEILGDWVTSGTLSGNILATAAQRFCERRLEYVLGQLATNVEVGWADLELELDQILQHVSLMEPLGMATAQAKCLLAYRHADRRRFAVAMKLVHQHTFSLNSNYLVLMALVLTASPKTAHLRNKVVAAAEEWLRSDAKEPMVHGWQKGMHNAMSSALSDIKEQMSK